MRLIGKIWNIYSLKYKTIVESVFQIVDIAVQISLEEKTGYDSTAAYSQALAKQCLFKWETAREMNKHNLPLFMNI